MTWRSIANPLEPRQFSRNDSRSCSMTKRRVLWRYCCCVCPPVCTRYYTKGEKRYSKKLSCSCRYKDWKIHSEYISFTVPFISKNIPSSATAVVSVRCYDVPDVCSFVIVRFIPLWAFPLDSMILSFPWDSPRLPLFSSSEDVKMLMCSRLGRSLPQCSFPWVCPRPPVCLTCLLRKWSYCEGDAGNGNEDDDGEPLFSCFHANKAQPKNPEQRLASVGGWRWGC